MLDRLRENRPGYRRELRLRQTSRSHSYDPLPSDKGAECSSALADPTLVKRDLRVNGHAPPLGGAAPNPQDGRAGYPSLRFDFGLAIVHFVPLLQSPMAGG